MQRAELELTSAERDDWELLPEEEHVQGKEFNSCQEQEGSGSSWMKEDKGEEEMEQPDLFGKLFVVNISIC
ncbi:unnamed protein product [Caretta caretta]